MFKIYLIPLVTINNNSGFASGRVLYMLTKQCFRNILFKHTF